MEAGFGAATELSNHAMRQIGPAAGAGGLSRTVAEHQFRHNNGFANGVDDRRRADNALVGIVGKRLAYQIPNQVQKGITGPGLGPAQFIWCIVRVTEG